MLITFDQEDKKRLLSLGDKFIKPALRVAVNKGIKEALKLAKAEVKDRYRLPNKASESSLSRPSLVSQLRSEILRSVGAVTAGVPGKIYAANKKLSLIRFLNAQNQNPQKQKGVKVANRKPVRARVGRHTTTFKTRFVVKTKGVAQVFRRMQGVINPKTKKERLALQRLASVHTLISQRRVQSEMEAMAQGTLEQTFYGEVQKRLNRK